MSPVSSALWIFHL